MPFVSHLAMRKIILDKASALRNVRMLGMDIGRQSIGLAISDSLLKTAAPLRIIPIDPQLRAKSYSFERHKDFYHQLQGIISTRCIKGIAASYPLDLKNNETDHCIFVKQIIKHMMNVESIGIPFTLVRERESCKNDSHAIIELMSGRQPNTIGEDKIACKMLKSYLKFLHSEDKEME